MRRRQFLFTALTVTAMSLTSAPAQAVETDTAITFIEGIRDEVLVMIKSPDTIDQKEASFMELMDRTANMRQIAGFALGSSARRMSSAQKERYIPAFKKLVAQTFVNRFDEYQGEKIEITGTRDAGKRGILVEADVVRGSDLPLSVGWLINDRSGEPLIADLLIEGISMAQSQRSEFTAQISEFGGNLDKFITTLEARVE